MVADGQRVFGIMYGLFQRGSAKSFSTGDALEQAQLLRRRAPHRVVVADHPVDVREHTLRDN